jgi:L,D-transpeptidase ErfK/SrfK
MNGFLGLLFLIAPQLSGGEFTYTVRAGDSLAVIGARVGVDARVIAEENGLKSPSRLQPGQTLQLNNRHIQPEPDGATIVVNIPQRMLFYFEGGKLSKSFPIAAGRRSWPTPTGEFEILTLEEDPVWDVPPSIQAEMARQGKPGLVTHGCVRLHPDDIEKLFALVDEGTTGRIIYEPVLIVSTNEGIYLEVHPDVYGRSPSPARLVEDFAVKYNVLDTLNWDFVKEVIRKRDGIARNVSLSAAGK